ncbi:hypothetical protein LTR78_010770 [Recurvomyces mirabilis]|uniref:Uncharacterized protein n=1 Tax=Recurvomyces mirabilis TaxID=574656 RepID=A0AAE0TM50_9PEZI|nr:hypothetical protein LTR78_010770 [Recurvomyces mirabilis]KAK5162348.1 hypothetical protein LTS14_000695 [Recurvomyces mirabilis]
MPSRFMLTPKAIRAIVFSGITILLLLTWPAYKYSSLPDHITIDIANSQTIDITHPVPPDATIAFEKPSGLRVIALIFYGRADRVRTLHCYLQRNLPEQGGWVDEVHFVQDTDNEDDLAYLRTLAASNPRYKLLDIDPLRAKEDKFSANWELLERDAIYVKIDDDLVFIADDTIPRLVYRKFHHPEYLALSANIISSPLMSKVQYDNDAYFPYLPAHNSSSATAFLEQGRVRDQSATRWRHTHYPGWKGPSNYSIDAALPTTGLSPIWLRLSEARDIERTPIRDLVYDTWGPGCTSWSVAAQSHMSLLEQLLHGTTSIYYNNMTDIWTTDYRRLSINFVAIDSNEVLSHLPIGADLCDEEWLTVNLPKRIGKHIAVETRALASHFSFFFQRAVEYTDILDRYADFANDVVSLQPRRYGVPILRNGGSNVTQEPSVTNGSRIFGSSDIS